MKKNSNLVKRRSFLFLLFLVFTTPFCQRVYSQEIKLSFSLKNATLKEIINEIKRVSVYDFVYSDSQLNSFRQRDVSFKNATIRQVLDDCLKDTDLEYTINGNTIVLKLKSIKSRPSARRPPSIVSLSKKEWTAMICLRSNMLPLRAKR